MPSSTFSPRGCSSISSSESSSSSSNSFRRCSISIDVVECEVDSSYDVISSRDGGTPTGGGGSSSREGGASPELCRACEGVTLSISFESSFSLSGDDWDGLFVALSLSTKEKFPT